MTLSTEQLNLHKTHVTASQVPTILGLNVFQSRNQLMLKKLRPSAGSDIQNEEALWRGHMLEETVAKMGCRRFELDWDGVMHAADWLAMMVENGHIGQEFVVDSTLKSKKNPEQYGASSDFIIPMGSEVINYEIKTSSRRDGWEAGKAPLHYRYQVQWQMAIIRSHGIVCNKTYFAGLLASNMGHAVETFDINMVKEAIQAVEEFFADLNEHQRNGTVPEVEKKDKDPLFVDENDEDGSVAALVHELDEISSEKRALASRERTIKGRLERKLQGYSGANVEGIRVIKKAARPYTKLMPAKLVSALSLELRSMGMDSFVDEQVEKAKQQIPTRTSIYIRRK